MTKYIYIFIVLAYDGIKDAGFGWEYQMCYDVWVDFFFFWFPLYFMFPCIDWWRTRRKLVWRQSFDFEKATRSSSTRCLYINIFPAKHCIIIFFIFADFCAARSNMVREHKKAICTYHRLEAWQFAAKEAPNGYFVHEKRNYWQTKNKNVVYSASLTESSVI